PDLKQFLTFLLLSFLTSLTCFRRNRLKGGAGDTISALISVAVWLPHPPCDLAVNHLKTAGYKEDNRGRNYPENRRTHIRQVQSEMFRLVTLSKTGTCATSGLTGQSSA